MSTDMGQRCPINNLRVLVGHRLKRRLIGAQRHQHKDQTNNRTKKIKNEQCRPNTL